MSIVVDTNQVLKLRPQPGADNSGVPATGITLAPYVIAEVLLRRDPEPMLAHLRGFNVRYGLELSDAFDRLACLSEAEIVEFEPFIKSGDIVASNDFCVALVAPSPNQKAQAQIRKQNNLDFCGHMFEWAKQTRRRLRDNGVHKRYSNLDEVLSYAPLWPANVIDLISGGSRRVFKVSDPTILYSAVE